MPQQQGFAVVSSWILLGVAGGTAVAAAPDVHLGAERGEVSRPAVFGGDLRDVVPSRPWKPGDGVRDIQRIGRPQPDNGAIEPGPHRDPLLDRQGRSAELPAAGLEVLLVDVEGGGFSGVNPPDPVGDVGPSHYIQAINSEAGTEIRIFDKTGVLLAGPFDLDSLASGVCAAGFGDPVVLYDELADRWLLSEFAESGSHLCVYISQTGDPVSGGWFSYEFSTPEFPDYPKYAVWPDAYYVTTNENLPAVYAFERAAMLTGSPARQQRITVPRLGGFFFESLTPADLDGSGPDGGSPALLARHRDDEAHAPGEADPMQDTLELWELAVDFDDPGLTTLVGPQEIPLADFDSSLCGLVSFFCIPQPESNIALDPLREVLMWRLQYRRFPSHESLIGNLAIDVDGNDRGGIRWFELRRAAAGDWELFQEGTYAPGSDHRWIGSAAMDRDGNMVLAYSIAGETRFPGLAYAGRLVGDPAGTLPRGELDLAVGSAANLSSRFGDYASLNVDPADGCTFWFTGELNKASSWTTHIGAFRFDACGVPLPPPEPPLFADGFESGDISAWDG